MAKLKVPSLQHLARNWQDSPEGIARSLIRLVKNPPTFSYNQLNGLVTDLLVLKQPLNEVMKAVELKIKRGYVRDNFLELLPLISGHFEAITPVFVQNVTGRMFPVSRELMIPFNPPLVYGASTGITFPWFSYWKTNPLAGERLSLFVSVVFEILKQDADLDSAAFQILDFSCDAVGGPRSLRVINAREVPRLSDSRLRAMLATFSEGYRLAEAELVRSSASDVNTPQRDEAINDGQGILFDEEGPTQT